MPSNNSSPRPISPSCDQPACKVDFSRLQPLRQLRPRLQHLQQWVEQTGRYDAVWDLCCDHGLLGLHLHESERHGHVYLVDQVPTIVDKLRTQYDDRNNGQLSIQLAAAETIHLPDQPKQCFIIAGVGGETAATIAIAVITKIQALLTQRPSGETHFELLISPNKHVYALRDTLRALPLTLVEEVFINDKGRHHEHMRLRYVEDGEVKKEIGPIGDALWQPATPNKLNYISKLVQHYQALCQYKANSSTPHYALAFTEYTQLAQRLATELEG